MTAEIYLEPWQLEEIAKCVRSPEYFVETYCWLQQKASAGVAEKDSILPFTMGNDSSEPHYFQRKILRWLHERKNVLSLKSRRVGCSWIAAAYAAWMVNFFPNTNILFISRNGAEAKKILAKVRFILKNLAYHDHEDLRRATRTPWLKGEFANDNQERLAVAWKDDQGEVVTVSEVVSLNNTDDAARGDDATFIVFDELAFYEHPDETWASAVTTLTRGGQWMAISCVHPDTYIFTENGIEQIKDYVSPKVAPKTFSKVDEFQIYGRYGLKNCRDVYNSGVTATRIITTKFGYQLECTHIHPILTNRNGQIDWIQAKHLRVGDWLPIKKGMMCFGDNCSLSDFRPPLPENPNLYVNGVWMPPDEMTEDLAYLLGLLIGDGYIDAHDRNNRIIITTTDQQIIDWLISNNVGLNFNLQKDGIHVVANQKQFVQFLELIDFPIDQKAPGKYIPKIIMTAPMEIIRSFLRGLFDADGCATKRGSISFVSTSERLIDQVHMLLLNFGIPASKAHKISKPTKKVKVESEQWVLEVGLFAHEFFRQIGFGLQRKQSRCRIVEKKTRSLKNIIPFAASLVRGIRHKLPQKPRNFDPEIRRRRTLSNRILIKNDRQEHKPISYQAAIEILDKYDEAVDHQPNADYYRELQALVEADYFWVQIVDIQESESLTYDFYIADGHSFISNGLVSHNTPNGIGDVFHRMCEQGDLAEKGHVTREELDFEYIKIHWSEAGISPDQKQKSSTFLTDEKAQQEWEFLFITPGSVVFHPTHLAQCYKPPEDYPEVAQALEEYREKVMGLDGTTFYYSGCDTIVGKAHKKSRDKDWNAFVSVTKSGIVAHVETNQVALSKWAGMTIEDVEYPGLVTQLHAKWPGILQVEEEGPGYTVINRYQFPQDTFSEMHSVSMKHLIKRGIIQRLILKVEAHSIVITDLRLYQQMQVFQQLDVGKFGAPIGYNDDLVIAFALALDALDKHGSLCFPWGDTTDKLKRTSMTAIMGEPMVELGQGPMLDYKVPDQYRRQSDFVIEEGLPSTDDLSLPYDYLIEELITDVPR